MNRRLLPLCALSTLICLSYLLMACVDKHNTGFPRDFDTDPQKQPTGITIAPQSLTLAITTTKQLSAFLQFNDGSQTEVTDRVDWQIVPSNIAAIHLGKITGILTGQAVIQATIKIGKKRLSDTANLRVTDTKGMSILVKPATTNILVGSTQAYTAMAIFADGHKQDITQFANWKTENPNIAYFSADKASAGLATGKNPGNTSVYADFHDNRGTAKIKVAFSMDITSIMIKPQNPTLAVGSNLPFKTIGIYSNHSQLDVTHDSHFTSSEPKEASINAQGIALGIKPGTVNITTYYKSFKKSTPLTVDEGAITTLTVTPEYVTKPVGTHLQYRAHANYTSGFSQDVTQKATWRSKNTSALQIVATGKNAGQGSAVGVGDSDITAEFKGASDTVTTTVIADKTVKSLQLSPSHDQLYQGKTMAFKATAFYDDGSSGEVTEDSQWGSNNQWVATVTTGDLSAGLVTGNHPGKAKVMATFQSVSADAEIKVLKVFPISLVIEPDTVSVAVHGTINVRATATMNTGDIIDYTDKAEWSSDNWNIATVDAGVIKGIASGTTTYRANFETVEAVATVTVTNTY